MRIAYYLLMIFILARLPIAASNTPSKVSGDEVKNLSKELESNTMKWTLVPKEKSDKQKGSDQFIKFSDQSISAVAMFIKICAIVLVVSFAILLLYLVFKDVSLPKKKQKGIHIELDDIQDITAVNFNLLLDDALAKGDYRLAVRIKFLTMLQQMQAKNKIVWKPNKTNRAYSTELSNTNLGNSFKSLSQVFEQIWYGRAQVNEHQFMHINTQFDEILPLI